MKSLKLIHKLGLVVFTLGFLTYLSLFFLGQYQLDKKDLQDAVGEQSFAVVNKFAEDVYGKKYDNQFAFVGDLKSTLKAANTEIKSTFEINVSLAEKISKSADLKSFQKSSIEEAIGEPSSEVEKWQIKQLRDYTGWMEGKEYNSSEELAVQLQKVIGDVNNSIISQKGFSKDNINSKAFTVAKKSEVGPVAQNPWLWLFLTIGVPIIGAIMYLLPRLKIQHAGIKNDGIFHSALKNRGWIGILLGTFLISFYVFLYWFPEYMTSWIVMVDPVSKMLSGNPASQWFMYGFLYTLAILVMGIRMIIKYRHSPYQMVRTVSVMFFQLAFAFVIPEILVRLNQPYMDLKNMWPLDYSFFFDYRLNEMVEAGTIGLFMLGWGIALFTLGVPIFTYLYGKRWYCSWVCGCGGLAETLGDPYRQLSDKSLGAWKIERWLIHGVLVFAVVMTAAVLYTYFTGSSKLLGMNTYNIRAVYGFGIGSVFSGVIGTGFYPFMGNRVWCRFGCPLAAYLGLVQRFKSRFRITTNGGQCISCGNCSTYCEMGIDVRWYAQRGQNIIRSSCVGCGVCSSVCPRGVLNLENRDENGRFNQPSLVGNDSFGVQS
ncbi:4Fe-4S dicluster domain-containing protein [Marivirga harenae]|uniref:4Fe-4S dicluster domain-containing protein n=1 Tax=Marivirga harenae TaxID=2010992 RepID=UPI0026DF602D|nr:4Fe-4S dicluster domain-containing protein [Marivirga harenae]WKV12034.1 4Fe-4S binding protein [Marivirga harenae]